MKKTFISPTVGKLHHNLMFVGVLDTFLAYSGPRGLDFNGPNGVPRHSTTQVSRFCQI